MPVDEFGIPTVPEGEADPEFAFLEDNPEPVAPEADPAVVEAPVVVTDPAAPVEVVPIEPVVTEPVVEEIVAEEEAAAAEELYLGKYKDIPAVLQGYNELRELQRRTAERARENENRANLIEAQAQQLQQTLSQAIPYIESLRAQQVQQLPQEVKYDQFGNPVVPPTPQLSPQQVQRLVDERVSAQTQQNQQNWAAEQQKAAAAQKTESAILGFYGAHPEVEVGGEIDAAIMDTINALNQTWESRGDGTLDTQDPSVYEIAYEATQRPALQKVLQMFPALVDDDSGMQLARIQAAVLEGQPITQQSQAVPASQVGNAQRKPFVEKASSSTPQTTVVPLSEFDEAALEWRKANTRQSDSVFFG